jgi:hypothetical protein
LGTCFWSKESARKRILANADDPMRRISVASSALHGGALSGRVRGKSTDRLDLSVLTAEEMAPRGIETRIGELLKFGFNRVLFLISPAKPDKQRPVLDRYAALIRKFV